MRFDIIMSRQSLKDLAKLDAAIAKRITSKLKEYRVSVNPLQFAKILSSNLRGLYRYRISDYNILFEKTDKEELTILLILKIKHQKDIYK